jgi:hypothetical protein
MDKLNRPITGIKTGLVAAAIAVLTGCVGYVEGGYGAAVVVPAPDVYVFGGVYERRHEVHEYSRRGNESRGYAHPERGGRDRDRR